LSRKTSLVNMSTGSSLPPGNPARSARWTSLPLTASIHSPAARTSVKMRWQALALMAYRARSCGPSVSACSAASFSRSTTPS